MENLTGKNKYFMISGSMRSGTTLISSILNTHTDIFVIPDILKWFWANLYLNYGDFKTEYQLYKALFELDYYVKAGLNKNRLKLFENGIIQNETISKGISYKSLFDTLIKYYSQGISNNKETHVGLKVTQQHNNYDNIINSFYDFKIIHMVRNCRDTYYSHKNYPTLYSKSFKGKVKRSIKYILKFKQYINHEQFFFYKYPKYIIDEWVITQEKALILKDKYPNKLYIVKYEDLILHPIETMNKILSFLKIDTVQKINYNDLKDKNGDEFTANSSFIKKTDPSTFDSKRIYNSFNKLSEEELEYYKIKASSIEKSVGYNFE